MPSQFRPCSPTLGILIFILIIPLVLVFAADMHDQPSVRHHRRRFEISRQVENTTSSTSSTPPPSTSSATLSPSSSSSVSFISSSSSTPSSSSASSSSQSTSFVSSASPSSSVHSSFTSSTRTTVQSSRISTSTPSLAPATSDPVPTTSSEPTPRTTLIIPPASSTSTALYTSTFSPSATSRALSNSNNGFMANKGAVAGTFTVVGVIGVGVIIAFLVFMRRRSKIHRDREDSFYQSFAVEPEMGQSRSGSFVSPPAGGVTGSSASSITELAAQNPMDPHVGNYASSYAPQGLAPVQERGSGRSRIVTSPPVSSRRLVGRSSYQPSIDSFYGGR